MLNFLALFRRHSPHRCCVAALDLLLKGIPVEDAYFRLRKEGFTENVASRCVAFIPSAFSRVYHKDSGYRFPEFFYAGAEKYKSGTKSFYRNEPVFQAALQLACQMRQDGDLTRIAVIAELSAEHRGICEAQAQGLTPTGSSIIIYNF